MPSQKIGSAETMLLLTRGDVSSCLRSMDPVTVVEDALRLHARGQSILPSEAYMAWENSQAAYCRSLAMPGALGAGPDGIFGMKLINAAVSNPEAGLARAGGFTALFEYETARPRVLAEGALISAVRTAAYTMASLRHIGPTEFTTVAIIGCGNLGLVHADLLRRYFPAVRHLRLFDLRPHAARLVEQAWADDGPRTASVHEVVPEALAGAEVVITLTTSSEPYIEPSWLHDRAFIAHVSLDDIRAEVFTGAAAIFVDDLPLVEDNPRRILGALLRNGMVARSPEARSSASAPHVNGCLGDVLCGTVEPVRPAAGRVVSNPFGMSILDLALLGGIAEIAQESGAGALIDLTLGTPAAALWGVKGDPDPRQADGDSSSGPLSAVRRSPVCASSPERPG